MGIEFHFHEATKFYRLAVQTTLNLQITNAQLEPCEETGSRVKCSTTRERKKKAVGQH